MGWWARRNGGRLACLSCDNMPRTLIGELSRSPGGAARFVVTRTLGTAARLVVDHVFAISSDIEAVMNSVGFANRVSVIPLGFDPQLFHPDPEARHRVRESLSLRDVTVAYFGRLIPEKGVHLLIDALSEIRGRRWQLMIDEFKEYDHPYVREIREQIERVGLQDRIVYFDANHDEVAAYMNAADVVVVPSVSNPAWKEQYGRVAPEAMACGLTVITSDCGALPELVGDAGVIVPEGNVAALRDAIARVIDDASLRESMGQRALKRAHAKLSVRQQVEGMHEIFSRWATPSAIAPRLEAVAVSS
jgi:glycosyltransferase involved in cell wall biosynthesis